MDPDGSSTSGELSSLTRSMMRSSVRTYVGPRFAVGGSSVVFVGLVGAADWFTGPGLSLVLAYALVVAAAGWLGSVRLAVTCAALSSIGAGLVAIAHPDSTISVGVAIVNTALRFALLIAVAVGVQQLRRTMAELSVAARRDPLTGLLNRRAVYEMAEHERARAVRSGRPMAIAYLDLDDLKRVNDTEGHEAGDELISRFAAALRMATRGSDLVGRIGGDEFVVIMPDTDYAAGVRAIDRLLSGDMVPRASCGIVTSARPDLSLDDLIAVADELMYEAKANGGGIRGRADA